MTIDYDAIYDAVGKISKISEPLWNHETEIKNILDGLGSIERKKLKEVVGRVALIRD